MTGENKTSNIPAIRFDGFIEEWVKKSIQNLIDEKLVIGHLDGNHGELYPRSDEFSETGTPYISANDFVNGVVNFEGCKYLPRERSEKFKKGISKNGDILFAHNATVGPVAKLETNLDFVIVSTTATYFRCDQKKLINNYLLQALRYSKFVEQYSRVMYQSTRSQVPITAQRKFYISIPKKALEQTKIGQLFQHLDTLINQHQQKHDKLLIVKKALLEKMFPQQGENQPVIRFKGFSGEWQEKQFGEIVEKAVDNRGKTPPTYPSGFYPLLEVASLGNIKPNYLEVSKYVDENTYRTWFRAHIKENDILFSTVGNTGLVSLMDSFSGAVIAQNIVAFRCLGGNNHNFVFSMFQLKRNLDKAKRIEMGAVQPSLKVSQLINVEYTITLDEQEQIKIGQMFQQLDTLINQHQSQLTKLNNVKQSLLSKMFV